MDLTKIDRIDGEKKQSYKVSVDLDLKNEFTTDFFLFLMEKERDPKRMGNFRDEVLVLSKKEPFSFLIKVYKGIELYLTIRFDISVGDEGITVVQEGNVIVRDHAWSYSDIDNLKETAKEDILKAFEEFKTVRKI